MPRFASLVFAVSLSLLPAAVAQQAPAAVPLAFEVASIKPAPDIASVIASHQMPHVGTRLDAGRIDIGFASLQDLICTAYALKPYQVSGPDWLTSERFDILATLPQGATKDQVPQMLQTLLAQRFQLTFHRDFHDLPVYALIVGKDGSKLPPAPADADAPPPTPAPGAQTIQTGNGAVTVNSAKGADGATTTTITGGKTGRTQVTMVDGSMHLVASKVTLPNFADMLTPMLDRPVLDQTGLGGAYQISLAVSNEDLRAMARAAAMKMGMPLPPALAGASGEASSPSGSSIFASVQKLGLRLDPRNAPVQRLVVDHIEKQPSAN